MGLSYFTRNIKKLGIMKGRDYLDFFKIILSFPFGMVLKLFRRDIWLISERPNDARDNGYWLFRYIREQHPEQKHVYYPIRFDCPDYEKIKPLGNAIRIGSFRHHIYFWAAEKNISAHVGNGFPASFMCRQFLMMGCYRFQNIFLQHGIIYNRLPYLNADVNKIDLFFCSTETERQSVIRDMGYRPEQVKVTGLCRYDNLYNFTVKKKQVLIMPTWRSYLEAPYGHPISESEELVRQSAYLKFYTALFHDERLIRFAKEQGLTLLYFPHNQMQPFLEDFRKSCPNIVVASAAEYDVQTALKESAFLITDYSSIFFDFAYMRKPMAYFQFDYAEFRSKHYPEGYFSYQDDGFGPVAETVEQVVDALIQSHQNGFQTEAQYRDRADRFFTFHDTDYCKRNYDAIIGREQEKERETALTE